MQLPLWIAAEFEFQKSYGNIVLWSQQISRDYFATLNDITAQYAIETLRHTNPDHLDIW